jgi:hypothetical protein
MRNDDRQTVSPFGATQNDPGAGSYVGAHSDRLRRFEARSARRSGDWSILEFPRSLLWLYSEPWLFVDDEYEFAPSVVIELWP